MYQSMAENIHLAGAPPRLELIPSAPASWSPASVDLCPTSSRSVSRGHGTLAEAVERAPGGQVEWQDVRVRVPPAAVPHAGEGGHVGRGRPLSPASVRAACRAAEACPFS